MKIAAVIPARLGSSRFPGKPLAALMGRPMIEHVYRRTKMCRCLDEVYIATCDQDIAVAAKAFGAQVLMTSPSHERASDRTAEAAQSIEADIIVMVQGDEPMIRPEMIELAIEPLRRDPNVLCVNLAAPILSESEFSDPNTIKVVMDSDGDALYFSREAIPNRQRRSFGESPSHKQVCIIPFRRDFLLRFARLSPTPLEAAESIDMLRALEHGYPVRIVRVEVSTHAVDTPQDLKAVELMMKSDPYAPNYEGAGNRS